MSFCPKINFSYNWSFGSKHSQRSHKRALDVKFYHKKIAIYLLFSIWNHDNHGTLLFFNTHECQQTQIENPFDPILSFGFIKDFWKWKILSLNKDIFAKDFQRTHIIKISWW
jgi:hypothetical protein